MWCLDGLSCLLAQACPLSRDHIQQPGRRRWLKGRFACTSFALLRRARPRVVHGQQPTQALLSVTDQVPMAAGPTCSSRGVARLSGCEQQTWRNGVGTHPAPTAAALDPLRSRAGHSLSTTDEDAHSFARCFFASLSLVKSRAVAFEMILTAKDVVTVGRYVL